MLKLIYPKFDTYLPLDADNKSSAKDKTIDRIVPKDFSNSDLTAYLVESPADHVIDTKVLFPNLREGSDSELCFVQNLSRDFDGQTIGAYHSNPRMNTQVYDVEFPDGSLQKYATNSIAENIYNNCDSEWNRWNEVVEIVGHNKADNAV